MTVYCEACAHSPLPAQATPTGEPVGSAVMAVRGGSGPVTTRYRIIGGPEETESDVTLRWEKSYPVYDEIESFVT